ncbi:MAG: hypothetical protein KAS32_08715, partial [Candidatus Peribacteraceae bacterium]|nr:hypothetical protein [Candidatus Peribacteraceae bacterium]
LKNTKCLKNVKVIDIQLIINDSKFTYSKEPSPLVVYHRNNNNLPFPIYKNDFTSLKDVYPDFSVDKNKLLDSPLGIRDLKMSISTEELFVRFWNKTTFRMEERKVKLDSDEIKQFCLYAAKWSIINYLIHIKHFSETSDEISSLLDEIDSEIEISYIQKEEILSGSKEKCIELLNIIENKLSV